MRRRARPRAGKIAADPVLRQFVRERLGRRWSPEQVSQALGREFNGVAHSAETSSRQPEAGGMVNPETPHGIFVMGNGGITEGPGEKAG